MGDRGLVVLRHNGNNFYPPHGVYLYTHWGGESLPAVVQRALARRERWEDFCYLARIVFCAMVKGHEDEEAGFGIAAKPIDSEHPVLVLTENERVHMVDHSTLGDTWHRNVILADTISEKVFASWSFEDYIAEEPARIQRAYEGKVLRPPRPKGPPKPAAPSKARKK